MNLTTTQRQNLLRLAQYIETLPPDYQHFEMDSYVGYGNSRSTSAEFKSAPMVWLNRCESTACAIGHAPAAGIPLLRSEVKEPNGKSPNFDIDWNGYSDRVFGTNIQGEDEYDETTGTITCVDNSLWDFLFSNEWSDVDNTHYGAAARIRYFLATDDLPNITQSALRKYAPYRKGSHSKVRKQIDLTETPMVPTGLVYA